MNKGRAMEGAVANRRRERSAHGRPPPGKDSTRNAPRLRMLQRGIPAGCWSPLAKRDHRLTPTNHRPKPFRFSSGFGMCAPRVSSDGGCREQQRFDRFHRQGSTLVTAPGKPGAAKRGAKSLKAAAASPWDDPAENAEGLVPALPSLVQFDMHRNQRRNSGADIDSAKPFRCSRRERCRARSRIRELFGIGFGFGFTGGVRICGSEIWFTGNRTGNRRTGNRLRGPESFHEQESRRARRFRTRQAWPYGCGIRLAHLAPFEFHFSIGVQSRGAMDFLGCSDVCEAMNSSAVRFSHFVRAFCGDRREKDTAQSACAEGCFRATNTAPFWSAELSYR